MRLDQSFEVQAPVDAVWQALNDIERFAPCMPGAAITGFHDGAYHGEFTLRVGPFAAVHRGTIRIESADEAARVAHLVVSGIEGTGSGATIVNSLTAVGGATRVDSVAELTVVGPLAAFAGVGVIQDILKRLLRDFATCMASRLSEPEAVSGTGATAPAAARATGVPPAPSGHEVAAGKAAPEALLAAAPEAQDPPDSDATAG